MNLETEEGMTTCASGSKLSYRAMIIKAVWHGARIGK